MMVCCRVHAMVLLCWQGAWAHLDKDRDGEITVDELKAGILTLISVLT